MNKLIKKRLLLKAYMLLFFLIFFATYKNLFAQVKSLNPKVELVLPPAKTIQNEEVTSRKWTIKRVAALKDSLPQVINTPHAGRYYLRLASCFLALDALDSGLNYLKEAEKVCPQDSSQLLENILFSQATAYSTLGQYQKSKYLYLKLQHWLPEKSYTKRKTLHLNLSNTYSQLYEIDSALLHIEIALKLQQEHFPQDSLNYYSILFNKANTWRAFKHYKEAKVVTEKCLAFFTLKQFEQGITRGHLNLAIDNFNLDKYKKAISHTDSVLFYVQKRAGRTDWQLLKKVFEWRSKIFEALEETDSALQAYKRYKAVSDTLNSNNLYKQVAEMEARLGLRIQRQENELLTQRLKAEHQKNYFLILLTLAFSTALGITLYTIYQNRQRIQLLKKNRIQQQELEKERAQKAEKELLFARQEVAHKQQEIALQKQQLSVVVTESLRKSEQFQELLELLKAERKNLPKEIRSLFVKKINQFQQSEEEWESLKVHFEEVHKDFFDKVLAQNPNLTLMNLRLCAYFRMGLSDKEIALLLNINPRSVEVSRYRLRKKLNFTTNKELFEFLQKL